MPWAGLFKTPSRILRVLRVQAALITLHKVTYISYKLTTGPKKPNTINDQRWWYLLVHVFTARDMPCFTSCFLVVSAVLVRRRSLQNEEARLPNGKEVKLLGISPATGTKTHTKGQHLFSHRATSSLKITIILPAGLACDGKSNPRPPVAPKNCLGSKTNSIMAWCVLSCHEQYRLGGVLWYNFKWSDFA